MESGLPSLGAIPCALLELQKALNKLETQILIFKKPLKAGYLQLKEGKYICSIAIYLYINSYCYCYFFNDIF